MDGAFPLLSLPPAALTRTLQSMDTLDQISISFVSKRTKASIAPLNLENCTIVLIVTRTFNFVVLFDYRSVSFVLGEENNEMPAPLTMAHPVTVNEERRVYHWTKEGYGIRDWIDHLMAITHASKIDLLRFAGQTQTFDVASIQNVIQGLEITKLISEGSTDYQQAVLEAFLIKSVAVRILPNQNTERLFKVFMQNYDSIEIDLRAELKLNSLQTMNSRVINIRTRRTDIANLLNPFLKLWKNGSSPRLEYLHFFFFIQNFYPDVNIVLKGIKHITVAREIQRTFKIEVGRNRGEKIIRGGFDVQGIHGKTATIRILPRTCEVFVWPQ